MYLRLTTFTKTLPQMSFHLYFFATVFLFRSGAPPMTLLTAGALTDPRLPATASNVCTTDARLGGVGRVPPHKQKSWLRHFMYPLVLVGYKLLSLDLYPPACIINCISIYR